MELIMCCGGGRLKALTIEIRLGFVLFLLCVFFSCGFFSTLYCCSRLNKLDRSKRLEIIMGCMGKITIIENHYIID